MTPLVVALVLAMPRPWGDLSYCSHEVVLGQPQSGKTTITRERVAASDRVVFVTPCPDDYREAEVVWPEDLEAEPQLLRGVMLRKVVAIGDGSAGHDYEQVARVVELVRWTSPRYGGTVLVLDEVGDYSVRCAEVLTKLHRNGHKDGVASVLISQCAVDVPLTCRRTATRVASLLQTRAEDLAALARDYGEPFAEQVRRWRPGDPPAVWTLPTMYAR